MNKYEMSFDLFLKRFKNHIAKLGYKNSIQKDYILKILYLSNEHLSAEDISNGIKCEYKVDVSIATVYRAMKFFEELNIVDSLDVGDNTKRYELKLALHHDHLVCTNCRTIIEFSDEKIEKLQLKIAKSNNFQLTSHVMTIYGLCSDCQ